MGQPQEEAGTSADEVNTAEEANGVLFNLESVKDIQLDLDPASVEAMSAQANAAYGNLDLMFAKRLTAKGTFRLNLAQPKTDPACDTTKAYEVKVKIKGMASVQGFDRKPSLKIDFEKPFCGLKNLALNNMVQDTSFVNEALAYKTYEAMGVPAPRLGYSSVVVNGAPLGLYLSLETIDKRFLARHFSNATGPIYEGTYGGDLRHGDVGTRLFEFTGEDDDPEANGNPQMHELISAIDAPGDHVFYGPGQLIDTAEFTSMLATAYVIGDWDNYPTANNYRVYRNPQTGLWSFIPTGTDQTFGAQPSNLGLPAKGLPSGMMRTSLPSSLFAFCASSRNSARSPSVMKSEPSGMGTMRPPKCSDDSFAGFCWKMTFTFSSRAADASRTKVAEATLVPLVLSPRGSENEK